MDDLQKSIWMQTDNSLLLARHILSEPCNIVFSPLSIHVSLGMIAAGSNGPTRDQIAGFVTSTPSDDLATFFSEIVSPVLADGSPRGGPVLSSANGLWLDLSLHLKPAFRDVLHKVYSAVSEPADFQNKETTPPLLDGSSVQAPLMSSFNNCHHFRAFNGFKVLRLPYEQDRDPRSFSMYIYLPDAKDGLPALRERICSESGFIDNHLPGYVKPLKEFRVPKFKFDFNFQATNVLKRMGLMLPFKEGQLTEMVDPIFPMVVSGMFHKAFIDVNEEGTEASAVSAIMMGGGGPPVVQEFVADHPFLFVIREDTKAILLFIGQLLNPLA